jgi:hypothetical protein
LRLYLAITLHSGQAFYSKWEDNPMSESQSGPIVPTIWAALDGSFDYWLHGVLRKPEFYWMFAAVVMIISFGVFMELQHRLCLAGWQDPIGRAWRRSRTQKSSPAERRDATSFPLGVTDEQFRRYRAFVDRVRSEYEASVDIDANIEFELAHFETDGRVVVNVYPKTKMGEAMIGPVRARLERQ